MINRATWFEAELHCASRMLCLAVVLEIMPTAGQVDTECKKTS